MVSTLLEYISSKLGNETQISLEEIHHKDKLDAPSGTAIDLRNTVTKILDKHSIKGCFYFLETNWPTCWISQPFHFRERQYLLLMRLKIDQFSLRALAATRWIIDMPPGLYGMRDFIDLT